MGGTTNATGSVVAGVRVNVKTVNYGRTYLPSQRRPIPLPSLSLSCAAGRANFVLRRELWRGKKHSPSTMVSDARRDGGGFIAHARVP